jgi:O-antigen/teichoic acid export membrane protein
MLNKLKPKSEVSRNILTLMTGTTIAQAIPIAISPILTRIYTPEDFGIFALYMSLLSIVAVIATGRYELAVMLPKNKKESINIVAISFLISFIISICLFVLVLFFNKEITLLIGTPEISNWLYLMPLSVFLVGSYQSLNYWNNKNKQYKTMAKSKIYQSVSVGTTNLTLGFIEFSKFGLIIGQLFGQIIAFFILLKSFIKSDINYLQNINRLKMFSLFKKYKDFPKINMPHAFLNTMSSELPVLMISKFFNNSNVGFYSLANLIIVAPMGIVSSSYSQVFLQKISELKNNNFRNEEVVFFKNTLYKLLIFSFPVFFIVFFIIEDIFKIVFGSEWIIAGTYSMILIPMLYFRFTGSIISSVVLVYNKQKKAFYIEVLNTILRFVSLLIGGFYNNILLGLVLFSATSSLISIYRLQWYFKIVKKG